MKLCTVDIAQQFGISDPIVDVSPEQAHVGEDGRALIVCSLWVDADETEAGSVAIVISGQDASMAQVPKEMAPRFGWNCGTAEFENGLIFLHRRTLPSEDEIRVVYLPRDGMTWGVPRPLQITPDLPTRITSKGFAKQVMPSSKGIGSGGIIAWPVEALTGNPETSVKSVAFFQPDIMGGRLNWSYWPLKPQPKGLFKRMFGGHKQELLEFVGPDPDAFPTFQYPDGKADELRRMPNILSSVFDGSRLLIASDGVTEIKKYGDRCAAISVVQSDGSIEHLYLEDFISPTRPDATKRHDYQTRFVSGGAKVLLKSRYKNTDPWSGGFALFDITEQKLAVFSRPSSGDYRGPMEIVGENALFVEFDAASSILSLRVEQIIAK